MTEERVIPAVVGPLALLPKVEALWDAGLPPGDKTGWPSLDRHYTVAPGQMTIVTGWPGSGKSEWLDAMLVNLMRQDWRVAMFSPENQPLELHMAKYLEKLSGMPFGPGPTPRIQKADLHDFAIELAGSLKFIEPPSEAALTAHEVIEAATPFLDGKPGFERKRALVIDPWNELEHWRPAAMSETEYVSRQLSLVRNWARRTGTHVWIVAHPQKMRRDNDGKLPVPRPDMISGSQNWWNKADACLTVFREMDEDKPSNEVHIYVQKVRFKHIGYPGVVKLFYDRVTGKYFEAAPGLSVVPSNRNWSDDGPDR